MVYVDSTTGTRRGRRRRPRPTDWKGCRRAADDIGADFGECDRDRGAQTAAGAGDDGDLVVEPESVEDHVVTSLVE